MFKFTYKYGGIKGEDVWRWGTPSLRTSPFVTSLEKKRSSGTSNRLISAITL